MVSPLDEALDGFVFVGGNRIVNDFGKRVPYVDDFLKIASRIEGVVGTEKSSLNAKGSVFKNPRYPVTAVGWED
jgi:hypothetical protein